MPEGSGFCVGCGIHNNIDALHAQKLTFEQEMKKAHEKRMFWDRMAWTVFGLFRWFR